MEEGGDRLEHCESLLDKCGRQLVQYKAKVDDLTRELLSSRARVDELTERLHALELVDEKYKSLQEKVLSLNEIYSMMKSRSESASQTIQDLKQMIDTQKKENDRLRFSLERSVLEHERQDKSKDDALTGLRSEHEALKERYGKLSRVVQEEMPKIMDLYEEKKKEAAQLEDRLALIEKHSRDESQSFQRQREELQALDSLQRKHLEESTRLRSECQSVQSHRDQERRDLEQRVLLQQRCEMDLRDEIKRLRSSHLDELEDYRVRSEVDQLEIESLKQNIAELNAIIQDQQENDLVLSLKSQLADRDHAIDHVQRQIEKIKSQFSRTETSLNEGLVEANEKIIVQKKALEDKDKFINGLQLEIDSVHSKMETLREEGKSKLRLMAQYAAQIEKNADAEKTNKRKFQEWIARYQALLQSPPTL